MRCFERSMSFNRKLSVEELHLITKILVGVDNSENSEKALNYALEIADKFSASVLILNVFQPFKEGFGAQALKCPIVSLKPKNLRTFSIEKIEGRLVKSKSERIVLCL